MIQWRNALRLLRPTGYGLYSSLGSAMSPPEYLDKREEDKEFRELCYYLGLALIIWQDVEDEHFALFFKITNAARIDLASIAYHSTESFEHRRVVVGRLVERSIGDKKAAREEWNNDKGGLQKWLKTANDNRNKLAHYSAQADLIGFDEAPDGWVTWRFGESRMQPAPFNETSRMLGRTPDKPEHNFSREQIKELIRDWKKLKEALYQFHSHHWPTVSIGIARTIGPPPGSQRTIIRRTEP